MLARSTPQISAKAKLASTKMACASIAIAVACAASPAFAQDNDGEYWAQRKNQITVTATRTAIPVSEAPATVTVKTDEEIADELATDIKDLVRFEPGVSVTRQPARFGAALGTTGRGGNEGFTIRGIGGNRVLIQVDGVRVPDGFTFGAQSAGRGDYVDIGLVKSVEILRGPTSALYGSDGLSGAVSFVTSDPSDIIKAGKNFGGVLRASYSSDDNEFAETAILAGRTGGFSAMFAYTRRDYNELENRGTLGTGLSGAVNIGLGNGSTRTSANPQDGQSDAFLARLVYETGGHKIRLTGEYVKTVLDADILSGRSTTVDSLTSHDTGERKRITGDWSWTGEGTIQSARAAVYWQDASDNQFTEELRTPAADRTRFNTFENRAYGASADLRASAETGSIKHTFVFGGDISFSRQEGIRGGTVPTPPDVFPTRAFPNTDYSLGGVFLGDEISIADGRLKLYPAVRWDHYSLDPKLDALVPSTLVIASQSGSKVSPKIGGLFKLSDAIGFFGNYTRGFKAPAPSQVNQYFENAAQGYKSLPSPNLRPETSEAFEGGVRVTSDNVTGSITVFKANYKDFIEQAIVSGSFTVADPAVYQFINIGRVKVDGVEGKLDINFPSGINARVAAAYARGTTSTPTTTGRLASIDPFTAVLGLGYREPTSGWFGGQFALTYNGQKEIAAATNAGLGCSGATCYRPNAVFLLDFTAHVRIADMITLRGGVFNIFDTKYALWSDVRGLATTSTVLDAYTRPGRNGSVSISFRF